jgi:hypothetical protein
MEQEEKERQEYNEKRRMQYYWLTPTEWK